MFNPKFMEEAIILSSKSLDNNDGGPFGCVIVKDNKIIGSGWNRVVAENDPTAHAEINAIRQACAIQQSFHLSDCEIYSSCEPCPMCLGAIYWARPSAVYYANTREDAASIGFGDLFIYNELKISPAKRSILMRHESNEKALKIFSDWFHKKNKIQY